MMRYTCEVIFYDPNRLDYNHRELLKIDMPESTYNVVKEECFKILSEKDIDLPKEYVSIYYNLLKQERLWKSF